MLFKIMVDIFHCVQIWKNSYDILRKKKKSKLKSSVYDSNLVKNGLYISICVNGENK